MKYALLISVLLVGVGCEINMIEPYPDYYDSRDHVVGLYGVEEYSETYNEEFRYELTISKSGSGNDIYLENFYDAGLIVRAELVGSKIFIPWQVRDGFEIEGVGTVNGSNIRFTYNVYDRYNDTPTDFCEARMRRDW